MCNAYIYSLFRDDLSAASCFFLFFYFFRSLSRSLCDVAERQNHKSSNLFHCNQMKTSNKRTNFELHFKLNRLNVLITLTKLIHHTCQLTRTSPLLCESKKIHSPTLQLKPFHSIFFLQCFFIWFSSHYYDFAHKPLNTDFFNGFILNWFNIHLHCSKCLFFHFANLLSPFTQKAIPTFCHHFYCFPSNIYTHT